MKKVLKQFKKISAVALLAVIIFSSNAATLSNMDHSIQPLGHGLCLDYIEY